MTEGHASSTAGFGCGWGADVADGRSSPPKPAVSKETGADSPVRGTTPTRPRTDHNPLNRKEYLLHVVRRV
jgi:hypothetical protein